MRRTFSGSMGRDMNQPRPLGFPALAAWLVWTCVCAHGASAAFRAGAAVVDITPRVLPIRTAGNLTLTRVDRVADPLHSRALVLENGRTRIVIAVVDSCMISRDDLDAAKAIAHRTTGIPVSAMLISSTHTHTAPAMYSCHGNDLEPEYRAWLVPRIAESIVQAWRNLGLARAGWGCADLPDFVHCRRWVMPPGTALHPNPAFTGQARNLAMMNPGHANTNRIRPTGPVDPAVTVLSVQTAAGRPLALLANYATHYGAAPSEAISADYFGEFCRQMARRFAPEDTDPRFVALISNGTSGDVNWIDLAQPGRKYSPSVIAEGVAEAAGRALREVVYRDDVPLAVIERRLTLATRSPTREQVETARAYLAEHVGERPTRTWEENYARETVLMADWPARVEVKIQAIRIGDLGLGALPCEVYASTGLDLKQASPFPVTMIISLANGCNGYLPPPDQFELGGYTTWRARSSYLETNAEPRLADRLVGLLKGVHRRR